MLNKKEKEKLLGKCHNPLNNEFCHQQKKIIKAINFTEKACQKKLETIIEKCDKNESVSFKHEALEYIKKELIFRG